MLPPYLEWRIGKFAMSHLRLPPARPNTTDCEAVVA
jgi:hypothetical protein